MLYTCNYIISWFIKQQNVIKCLIGFFQSFWKLVQVSPDIRIFFFNFLTSSNLVNFTNWCTTLPYNHPDQFFKEMNFFSFISMVLQEIKLLIKYNVAVFFSCILKIILCVVKENKQKTQKNLLWTKNFNRSKDKSFILHWWFYHCWPLTLLYWTWG
jgi:hypothetical protein